MRRLAILLATALPLLAGAAPAPAPAPAQRRLADVAARYGFPAPAEGTTTVQLRSPYTTLEFVPNSRRLLVNGTLVWLNGPLAGAKAKRTLAQADVDGVLDPLLRPDVALRSYDVRTVVLDAGHGGHDTGARGAQGVVEKDATLDITRRVARKLANSGFAVRLTRSTDQWLPLATRTGLARKWAADLFVSIHLNAAGSAAANGVETYALTQAGFPSTVAGITNTRAYVGNAFDPLNTLLAYYLHRGVVSTTAAPDRGLKRARFDLLRDASCPAALVECGFVSNGPEGKRLLDKAYRERVADGIARGILTFAARARAQPSN